MDDENAESAHWRLGTKQAKRRNYLVGPPGALQFWGGRRKMLLQGAVGEWCWVGAGLIVDRRDSKDGHSPPNPRTSVKSTSKSGR